MRSRLVLTLGICVFWCGGCQRAPNSPSSADTVGAQNLSAWAPCIVVQSPGGAPFTVQMEAARTLQRAGRLTWVRLNAHLDRSGLEYHRQARQMGLHILSIIHLIELERVGWENAFDALYSIYPSDIWEIGGEISNGDPNVNPVPVTPDYYMSKLKSLYRYVRSKYPGVVLASAPTVGTGSTGSLELEEFVKLGLLDMDLVIPVNVYSNHSLSSYAAIFGKYAAGLAGKRIWVTETGSANPENHIAWVQEFYPRLAHALHPEMVCWYAMWGGDIAGGQGDNGFGMLDRVESGSAIERPLFKALAGER